MTYFHHEEECQFGVLSDYDDEHPGTRYRIEFPVAHDVRRGR